MIRTLFVDEPIFPTQCPICISFYRLLRHQIFFPDTPIETFCDRCENIFANVLFSLYNSHNKWYV